MVLDLSHVDFLVCTLILFIGLCSLSKCLWLFFKAKSHPNILYASALMLLGDVSMIANFLPRSIYNLTIGYLDTSSWCDVSAVWTIASFFALGGGSVLIAFVTERSVVFGAKSHKYLRKRFSHVWTLTCWSIGFFFGGLFYGLGEVGPFNGTFLCFFMSIIE